MSRATVPDSEVRAPLLPSGGRAAAEPRYGGVSDEAVEAAPGPPRQGRGGGGRGTFTRDLGTLEAFGIVVSIVIGSGVFTSPGAVDSNVPSPGAALAVWLAGGALAWTGAATMAELGAAIPGEGGVQPYLARAYGSDALGFLAAWTWVVAVMPATLAILAIVFVESMYSAAGVTDRADRWEHKLLSVGVLVVITVANSVSTRASTRLNNFFVVTKFATIFAIVVAGVGVIIAQLVHREREDIGGRDWFTRPWFGYRETVTPDGERIDWRHISQWDMFGHYAGALYAALWGYSGWDKAIYVSAELKEPARQLPLAINTSIPSIIVCFLAANAAYYILLPWSAISETDSVAVTAITRLLGPAFGIVAAVLICLVVAGSLLGNSFVAGRMAVAAANKSWLPRIFGLIGRVRPLAPTPDEEPPAPPRSDAPINALVLSAALSALYVLFGNFRALLTFNGLGEYTFFFLAVVGALILRYREPHLERPYKPPVLTPVIFAVVSGFVVVRGAVFAPIQAALLAGVWGVGLLFYWAKWLLWLRRQ